MEYPFSFPLSHPVAQHFSSPATLSSLLFILDELLSKLVSCRVTDPVGALCKSLVVLAQWYLNALCHVIQQVLDQPEMWNHQRSNVELILRNINALCNENKATCLLFIACAEEANQERELQTLKSGAHSAL